MILKQFKNRELLEEKLSNKIGKWINKAISKNGSANILLSGGSTPIKLYQKLGEQNIDWSKVNVGLVDERFVPKDSPHNNHLKIEEALNKASKTNISVLPMVINENDQLDNLEKIKETYSPFFDRIDFSLLGMGEDGHTASLFPGDPQSIQMLKDSDKNIGPSLAPNSPKERISCNKALLEESRKLALMIVGQNKLDVLEDSLDNNLPISQISKREKQLKVYFTA